jgi:hypothetical protein
LRRKLGKYRLLKWLGSMQSENIKINYEHRMLGAQYS